MTFSNEMQSTEADDSDILPSSNDGDGLPNVAQLLFFSAFAEVIGSRVDFVLTPRRIRSCR